MKHTWKKTAAFIMALMLVAVPLTQAGSKGGLFGGTTITAYAAGGTEVTQANVICQQYSYMDADTYSGGTFYDTPPADITNIELADAQAFGAAVNCPTTYWVVVYAKDDGDNLKWTSNGKTGEQTSTPRSASGRVLSAWCELFNNDVFSLGGDPMKDVTFYFSKGLATVSLSGIELNKNETNLTVGGSETLTAILSPDDATDKTVTWSSDNTAVATVDETGKVTAVSAGTANITATATNGTDDTSDDQTATCAVIVNSASSFSNVSLSLGDDLALNFYSDTITADNYTEYSVKFSGKCVDSESGFELKNGKYCATTHIFAKNMNEKITAALYKGEEQIGGELEYSVNDYLNAPAHSYADDKTKTLIAATKKYGEAADNYFNGASNTFTFSDIDASAYAPDFGAGDAKLSLVLDSKTAIRLYVKGVTAGTEASGFTSVASSADKANAGYPSYFEITGLTPKQLAAQQSITVDDVEYKFSGLSWAYLILNNSGSSDKNKNMAKAIMEYYTAAKNYAIVDVSEVSINTPPTRLNVGDTGTFSATVSPDNATDKTVTWSASPSGILTIDSATGAYEAVGTGEVTVTATAGGKTASCTMNVVVPVSGIVINNAPTEALFVNSTGTLTATVSPNNATDKTVVWSSSDPDYVSINAETGEYTIMGTKGYGSATITATATNGTEDTSDDVSATCTITGKVHHTSLQVGDVIRVGETIYTGDKWQVNISPVTSFTTANGVITLVEDKTGSTTYYKMKRGSNGAIPNWTSFKVTDDTDGLYIVSGTGTNSDKFVFAVHTKQSIYVLFLPSCGVRLGGGCNLKRRC